MDATLQNLDEQAYQALQARATVEGRPVGELISEAIRVYLARKPSAKRSVCSLRELQPEPYPEGNERLTSEIDRIVYSTER